MGSSLARSGSDYNTNDAAFYDYTDYAEYPIYSPGNIYTNVFIMELPTTIQTMQNILFTLQVIYHLMY